MKKKSVFWFITLVTIIGSIQSANSYVRSRTTQGNFLYWKKIFIEMNLDTTNSYGFSSSTLKSIAMNSASQWEEKSNLPLEIYADGEKPLVENEIYFSSENFGSGVLAVTQLAYDEASGEIKSSKIAINNNLADTITFSTNSDSDYYLGDIITHEMGHALGLGHGETKNTTMFYSWLKGQYLLDDDDKAGIHAIYPKYSASSLTGKIVGGKSLVGVMASHVQAISSKTGKVKASSFSDENGLFKIEGLDADDVYYLYISPAKKISSMPGYYLPAQSSFCLNSTKYRGAFFQKCDARETGYPQEIFFKSANSLDVGSISIRCNIDSPPDYFIAKAHSNAFSFDLSKGINSFVGYFTEDEGINEALDQIEIDLTSQSFLTSDYYLEVKVISQEFYSPIKLTLSSDSANLDLTSTKVVNDDGSPNLDIIGRIPLDTNSSNNLFNFSVKPKDLLGFFSTPQVYTKNEYFPVFQTFLDNQSFYQFVARVVKKEASGVYTPVSTVSTQKITDNSTCPDAPLTYSTKAEKGEYEELFIVKKSDQNFISCGTVDLGDNSGGGPRGFALGVCCVVIFSYFRSKIKYLS